MVEYIEREAALREGRRFLAQRIEGVVRNHATLAYETCNPTEFAKGYQQGAMDGINAAISIPAADVAPVVRCKDCKWWKDEICTNVNGAYKNLIFNPNWYCASGERRDK